MENLDASEESAAPPCTMCTEPSEHGHHHGVGQTLAELLEAVAQAQAALEAAQARQEEHHADWLARREEGTGDTREDRPGAGRGPHSGAEQLGEESFTALIYPLDILRGDTMVVVPGDTLVAKTLIELGPKSSEDKPGQTAWIGTVESATPWESSLEGGEKGKLDLRQLPVTLISDAGFDQATEADEIYNELKDTYDTQKSSIYTAYTTGAGYDVEIVPPVAEAIEAGLLVNRFFELDQSVLADPDACLVLELDQGRNHIAENQFHQDPDATFTVTGVDSASLYRNEVVSRAGEEVVPIRATFLFSQPGARGVIAGDWNKYRSDKGEFVVDAQHQRDTILKYGSRCSATPDVSFPKTDITLKNGANVQFENTPTGEGAVYSTGDGRTFDCRGACTISGADTTGKGKIVIRGGSAIVF
jgi:hypothetical protein